MLKLVRFVCLLFVGMLALIVVMVGKSRSNSGETACLVSSSSAFTSATLIDTSTGASIDIETPYGAVLHKLSLPSGSTSLLFTTKTHYVYEGTAEDGNNALVTFDTKTGAYRLRWFGESHGSISKSGDGRYIAAIDNQYSVRILTLSDLQIEYTHYRPMNDTSLYTTQWSNSGHLFAFLELNARNEVLLTIVDADTLRSTSVTVFPDANKISPGNYASLKWSADDEAIVVNSTTTMVVYFRRNNTLKQVADNPHYRTVERWTGNIHQLAYTSYSEQAVTDFWVYDADTGLHTLIAAHLRDSPWYSHDFIYVILTTESIDNTSIRLVNLLTHDQFVLRSDGSAMQHLYWLDETHIAVTFEDKFIWMNEDGSGRHEVAMIAGQYGPYLSSQHLMTYQVRLDGKAEMGVIDLNSGTRRKIGSFDVMSDYMAPSPDGRTIAHLTKITGTALSLLATDTSRLTRLPTVYEAASYNSVLIWSPDSTRVALFLPNNSPYMLVQTFSSTGEPISVTEVPTDNGKTSRGWNSCEIPEPSLQ